MEELSLDLNERRVDGDGVAYTFEEYVDICGFSLEEQLCVAALSRWRTNSAEQPVDTSLCLYHHHHHYHHHSR